MSKPTKYTAHELLKALDGYGNLVVAVGNVDAENTEHGPFFDLRLELSFTPSGERFLAIVGYESEDAT